VTNLITVAMQYFTLGGWGGLLPGKDKKPDGKGAKSDKDKKLKQRVAEAEKADIDTAAAGADISSQEVEIDVLSEGKHGILGRGAEDARVRITLMQDADKPSEEGTAQRDELIEATREVLEGVLSRMGREAVVNYSEQAVVQEGEGEATPVVFDVEGDGLGILIGRRGQTLACLQYIIRLIVSHRMKPSTLVVIDVNGYKQHRYQSLNNLANRIAEEVEANNKSFELEPMPAYERRIIHIALANNDKVTTESIGFGDNRKVVIMPRES
jgi:spoIIIJ-associated protein